MDLNRVVTFVRVVEAGTFTAAATSLELPTSSVSRSVSKLEQELGIVLLERTTRRVALTDAGRAYYERAREALAGLDQATTAAGDAQREPSGVVRIAVPPEMTGKLSNVLAEFLRRYPRIHVDVVTTSRGAELVGGEVDLAVVLGRLADSELLVRRLGTSGHRLYASRDYLARRGRPAVLADLAAHDAVMYRGSGGRITWALTGPRGVEEVEVRGPLSTDSHQFVFEAIAGGLGIGLLPEQYLACQASAPTLEPVLPDYAAEGAVQSLVMPSRHLPKRVQLLRDHLGAEIVGCPGAH